MDAVLLLVSFAVILAGALLFTNAVEWLGHRLGARRGRRRQPPGRGRHGDAGDADPDRRPDRRRRGRRRRRDRRDRRRPLPARDAGDGPGRPLRLPLPRAPRARGSSSTPTRRPSSATCSSSSSSSRSRWRSPGGRRPRLRIPLGIARPARLPALRPAHAARRRRGPGRGVARPADLRAPRGAANRTPACASA